MKDLVRCRRLNLKTLIDDAGTAVGLAKRVGLSNGSYLSQLTNPNSNRSFTEKTARQYEEKLGLIDGWLDLPNSPRPQYKSKANTADKLTGEALRSDVRLLDVRSVLDELRLRTCLEHVAGYALTPAQSARVVALAYKSNDATDNLESVIKNLVELIGLV